MKRLTYLTLIFLFSFGVFLIMGCGGSQKTVKSEEQSSAQGAEDDYDEIERLLGITRPEEASGKAQGSNDDLIKLLEADEGKAQGQSTQQELDEERNRIERINKQAETLREQLNKELKKKDLEIADLKAQLMLKEEELRKYKSGEAGSDRQFRSLGRAAASGASGHQAPADYIAEYERGLELFHQHRYRDAIEVFDQLLARDTNNDYADNAQYWIGECYYALGRYREAIIAFEKVFTFRFSNKNDYAQFKIGQCYFKLGDKQRARQEFQQLLDNYPQSPLVNRTREYLAQL